MALGEDLARNVHEVWAAGRIADGWTKGPRNDALRQHPCLVPYEELPEIEKTLFSCTTAIGLRKYPVKRVCMEREILPVTTIYGTVNVKRCRYGNTIRFYPEFESVKAAVKATGSAYQEVFAEAARLAKEQYV